MTFEEYYKSFGLNEYPFGVFTSEAELANHSELFVRPPNYSVIIEGLRNTSALVLGERGTGKTALGIDIEKDFNAENNLIVRVHDFSDLESEYEASDLYRFLTKRISEAFFFDIAEYPRLLWKLTKNDRIDLSFFLFFYIGSSTKQQLTEKINRIQNSLSKRWALNAYNFSRVAINYGLRAATKVLSDALTQHFSALPKIDDGDHEYFKKIENDIDQSFTKSDREFFYLEKVCKIIEKCAYKKIYVIVDKIDEDTRFDNDAELIAPFIKKIASDNKILTSSKFHMLLFFWTTPFNMIKQHVRTQKISLQSLDWSAQQLIEVANQRLKAYSENNIQSLDDLFDIGASKQELRQKILGMSNNNPRDLWHILNKCLTEQFEINPEKRLTKKAVDLGINNFVSGFNYYEYYPKKARARRDTMDVYAYIKHLSKLDNYRFTKNRLNALAGTGGSTNNYVVSMENMGLIKRTSEKGANGAVLYEIKDPKVIYAMQNNIPIGE